MIPESELRKYRRRRKRTTHAPDVAGRERNRRARQSPDEWWDEEVAKYRAFHTRLWISEKRQQIAAFAKWLEAS